MNKNNCDDKVIINHFKIFGLYLFLKQLIYRNQMKMVTIENIIMNTSLFNFHLD